MRNEDVSVKSTMVCIAVRRGGVWVFNPDNIYNILRDWLDIDIKPDVCVIDFDNIDVDIDVMCNGEIIIRRGPREVIIRSCGDIVLTTGVAVYIDPYDYKIEEIVEEELKIEQQGYIVEYYVNTGEIEIVRNYSWYYSDDKYDHDGYEKMEVYKFVKKLFEKFGGD